MKSLFGGETSSLSAAAVRVEPGRSAGTSAANPGTDLNTLITGAARDLADYQRLTAEGKLGEAGQKLEQLKQKLDQLNARQK
jgi:hypothetical protein